VIVTEEILNCYQTLGLQPNSSIEEIKSAYRKLVKQWHPDRFYGHSVKNKEANERLKQINPAYKRLIAFYNGKEPTTPKFTRSKPSPPPPPSPKEQFEEGRRHEKLGEYEIALQWFKRSADRGYADAMFKLGNLFYDGIDVKENRSTAADWYRKAAEKGYAEAQYKLGQIYEYGSIKGFELSADYREALKWYLKAAEQGLAKAQIAAAWLYRKKCPGITTDYRLAIYWLRKAAAQGLAEAENGLGHLYEYGVDGLVPDYKEAAIWYRRAAEKEDVIAAYAQLSLSRFYEEGLGVPKDTHQADYWLRRSDWAQKFLKSGKMGSVADQFRLAHMYETGIGIKQNLKNAFKWYKTAAIWGLAKAQIKTGQFYQSAIGMNKNLVEAYRWFAIAKETSTLNTVALEMTAKEIEKAKRLASEFSPGFGREKPKRRKKPR
jgi:TPR repeat protein